MPAKTQQTAMQEAFARAGYTPAQERLAEAAAEALKVPAGGWEAARDKLFAIVRRDADLLWEMFAPFANEAARKLLNEVAALQKQQETEQRRAKVRPVEMPARAGGGAGQIEPENQNGNARLSAPPATPPAARSAAPPPPAPPTMPSRPSAARTAVATEGVSSAARISVLRSFLVNDKPLGDVTMREAQESGLSRGRQSEFLALLTAGQPPHRLVRDCVTEEYAADLYRSTGARL